MNTTTTTTTTTTRGAHVRLMTNHGRQLFAGAVGVVLDVPSVDTITIHLARVGAIDVPVGLVELTTAPQTSAAGCGREHAVPCQGIGHSQGHRPMTWNASGYCDDHLTGQRGAF